MARASPTRLRIPPDSSAGAHPLDDLGFRQVPVPQPQRHVFGHGHRVEQGGELEHVADVPAHGVELRAVELGDHSAVNDDLPGVGVQQPDDVFQHDALARPRIPDEHQGLAVAHREREPGEDLLRAERFVDILELDHSSTTAQKASSMRMSTAEYTTARMALCPTPSAPPRVPRPTRHPTRAIVNPNVALLNSPNQRSLKT